MYYLFYHRFYSNNELMVFDIFILTVVELLEFDVFSLGGTIIY